MVVNPINPIPQIITNLPSLKVVKYGSVIQIILLASGIANGDDLSNVLGGNFPITQSIALFSNSNDGQIYHLRLGTSGIVNIISTSGSEISGAISAIGTLTYITDNV